MKETLIVIVFGILFTGVLNAQTEQELKKVDFEIILKSGILIDRGAGTNGLFNSYDTNYNVLNRGGNSNGINFITTINFKPISFFIGLEYGFVNFNQTLVIPSLKDVVLFDLNHQLHNYQVYSGVSKPIKINTETKLIFSMGLGISNFIGKNRAYNFQSKYSTSISTFNLEMNYNQQEDINLLGTADICLETKIKNQTFTFHLYSSVSGNRQTNIKVAFVDYEGSIMTKATYFKPNIVGVGIGLKF
jgi:hypothetical protein